MMIPTRKPTFFLLLSIISLPLLLSGLPSEAQTASALLAEGDPLPGFSTVDSIIQPAVNHVGGYSLTINTNESGNTVSHIWGNTLGGPGSVLITEGIFGDYEQISYEAFHGFSDAVTPATARSPTSFPRAAPASMGSGSTPRRSFWKNSSYRASHSRIRLSTAGRESRPMGSPTGSEDSAARPAERPRTARCSWASAQRRFSKAAIRSAASPRP